MAAGVFLALILLQDPDAVLTQIGVDQKLDSQIDLRTSFRDEAGKDVQLGAYFGKKPVILTPVYYECPMLCSLALNGLVKALRAIPFAAGKDFEIVTFSFDPKETSDLARAKKEQYMRDYGQPQAEGAWHFLTGTPESIQKLTSEIGFRYAYDTNANQWAHASVLVVLTPDGRVSKYLDGVDYDAATLRLSLVEASHGEIGSVADAVFLSCFHYNPTTGKYDLAIMRILRVFGSATVLGLAALIFVGVRKRRART